MFIITCHHSHYYYYVFCSRRYYYYHYYYSDCIFEALSIKFISHPPGWASRGVSESIRGMMSWDQAVGTALPVSPNPGLGRLLRRIVLAESVFF